MKARNNSYSLPQIDSMSGTSLGTSVVLTDQVQCIETSIKGNFTDANPWGYVVDRHRRHYGYGRFYTNRANYLSDKPYRTPYGPVGSGESATVTIPPYDKSLLYNQALSRVYDKLRGDLDLAVDIAESHQTKRMFGELARWERYLGGWGPRRWANEWLQYQYGWKPLIRSCYGAATELRNFVAKKQRITGSAKQPFSDFKTKRSYANLFQVDMVTNCRGKAGCRIVLDYTRKENDLARWSSLNPVSIAWELMPYSFVVDWFFDVGSTLRNLETSFLYSQYVTGYMDELYAVECKEVADFADQPFAEVYWWKSKAYRRRIEFSRTVLTSAPMPRLPQFKVKMGWQRWISAWALTSQILLGPKARSIPGWAKPLYPNSGV